MAVLDRDGYCQIVGRLKEVSIRGSENIHPREIEELLYTHAEVEQAYVIGVPDLAMERRSAWIKPVHRASLCPEELRDFCRKQMAPQSVTLFPLCRRASEDGEVRKAALRERALDTLSASELEVA